MTALAGAVIIDFGHPALRRYAAGCAVRADPAA